MTRTLVRVVGLAILISIPASFAARVHASEQCKVGDFKSANSGNLSVVQQLAYLSVISKTRYKKMKDSGDASGAYGIIAASANYSDFEERLNKVFGRVQFSSYNAYKKNWATSSLDKTGLEAYLACLQQEGGFRVTVQSLDESAAKLSIDWVPGEYGELDSAPTVLDSSNVANVEKILQVLGTVPWGTQPVHRELVLRPSDNAKPSDITFGVGHSSYVEHIPPKSLPLSRPAPAPQVSWDGVGAISRRVPADALAGQLTLAVHGHAYSGGTGEIWIDVYLTTASGRQQECASQHASGSYNIGIDYRCQINFIPYDAETIEISAGNSNANAKDVHAQLYY